MEVIKTDIDGVVIIEPKVFGDHRGYFFESFSQRDFDEQVREVKFVQDNESKSCYGVLRGLHFQKPPHAQSKLVRVVKGAVLDVAVDIRRGSPTFGKHVAVELTEDNHRQFFVPRGFAHKKRNQFRIIQLYRIICDQCRSSILRLRGYIDHISLKDNLFCLSFFYQSPKLIIGYLLIRHLGNPTADDTGNQ